jgi:CheY-like chemotaxis protein
VILGLQLLQEHLNALNINCPGTEKVLVECLELTDELAENAAVAVTTLNDLINYDKIETKTFTIEKKMVNVSSVAEKTVSLLAPQAKEKDVRILFESEEPHNLRVFGDSVKLAQVIRNLTSNALKFTPAKGTITVAGTVLLTPSPLLLLSSSSVHFESENIPQSSHRSVLFLNHQAAAVAPEMSQSGPYAEEAGHVVITVRDTGPGLSPEQQLTLFREGVQFNPNELQGGQGSGLGLWISREIVSLHGGTIAVTSEGLNQGSTFEVRLPLRRTFSLDELPSPSAVLRKLELSNFRSSQAPDPVRDISVASSAPVMHIAAASPVTHPSPPQSQTEPFFSPHDRHVLVVDDAPSNRKLVSRLLRSRGFVCHEAENGLQCVEKIFAAAVPYEFIVLDYEMPVLDGPSAARQLRENRYEILIIGVTGNVLPEDREFFLKQGANAVLPKPVNIDELLNKVSSLQADAARV